MKSIMMLGRTNKQSAGVEQRESGLPMYKTAMAHWIT
jgi:hypothetical protein